MYSIQGPENEILFIKRRSTYSGRNGNIQQMHFRPQVSVSMHSSVSLGDVLRVWPNQTTSYLAVQGRFCLGTAGYIDYLHKYQMYGYIGLCTQLP